MGVWGLTGYLHEKQHALATTIVFSCEAKTPPKPVVIDAWSFIYKVFYEAQYPWVYGGEYELFARDVAAVVRAWKEMGLEPHFVFDGPEPAIKFPEHIRRIQDARIRPSNIFFRTSAARRNEATFLRDNSVIPPLVYGACVSILRDLDVHCVWAEGEADLKCVELAASLSTWVIGKDSDFGILNAEGYEGYIPMDKITWEYQQVKLEATQADEDDGWISAVKPKGKGKLKNSRSPTTDSGILHFGLLPPSSGSLTSIKFIIYHPKLLAAHLKVPITFLPLLSSLVGNDFVPKSYRQKFLERGKSSGDFINHVASVLKEVLSSGQNRRTRIGKRVAKNMVARGETDGASPSSIRPSVATLIQTAIQGLLIRPGTNAEIDEMVETIIDAILQYGADSDPMGPFANGVSASPHPYQEAVRRKYTEAYTAGDFSPRIVQIVSSGTAWPNLFLEDPDVHSCSRTVGVELVTWVAAILNDGLTVGVRVPVDSASSVASGSLRGGTGDRSTIGGDEEDDDELIDVIEEQTDSEEELERGRSQTYDPIEEVGEESDDEGGYGYASYTSGGVPSGLLTSALKRLRRQQRLRGDGSNGRSPMTNSAYSASAVTSPGFPNANFSLSASIAMSPPQPTSIAAYYRSGLRIVSHRLPIQTLPSLLDATSRGRAPLQASGPVKWNWQGPIQLQSLDLRMKIFMHAMQCNTTKVRELDPDWVVLVAALRWTVMKLAERAQAGAQRKASEGAKWKKSEAKAFLACCVQGPAEESETSNSPSIAGPPAPIEATPRAIQLTSQVLTSIEATQHLGQALLLANELKTRGVERKFSGLRFHTLIANQTQHVLSKEENALVSRLLEAVEEDSKAEWWGSEVTEEPAAPKRGPNPPPRKRALSYKTPIGIYGVLPALGSDW